MRVKLIANGSDISVVNAATGEILQGITHIFYAANMESKRLVLTVIDFDVDIEAEAQVRHVQNAQSREI